MILQMILKFLILSVAVYVIARIFPGVRVRGFKAAMAVAAVYALLNFVLFRLLIFITFPLVALKYLTLGIFGILLNAVLLVITDRILDDFELSGFGAALIAAVGISLVNLLLTVVIF